MADERETSVKDGVEKAVNNTELVDSMMEWLVNEKKIDDCWYCGLEDVCPDVPRDRVLTNTIKKMMPELGNNPGKLKACMTDLERLHPWTRALANLLGEAADELLERSLSNTLL